MKDPRDIFFDWLGKDDLTNEKKAVAQLLLDYIPGTSDIDDESENYHKKLLAECSKKTSVCKIYGLCFFIHYFLSDYFKEIQEAYDFMMEEGGSSFNTQKLALKVSWETLERFNPEYFKDWLHWIQEEVILGETNNRLK